MKETNIYNVRTFEHGDYLVEIVKRNDGFLEAWLRHKDYGFSTYMFGCDDNEVSDHNFIKLVEGNLEREIEYYEMEVKDDDIRGL